MNYRNLIRHYELDQLKIFFNPGLKVLEIGGGNGFQASIIKSWGLNVESIDTNIDHKKKYFEVKLYDGMNLPFPDQSFDVVYSSNVMEHVEKLGFLLKEIKRVTKNGGIGVHLIPSSTWRLWTIIAHFPYLLARLFHMKSKNNESSKANQFDKSSKINLNFFSKIIPQPHGEFSSAFAELYYFSKVYWKKIFKLYKFKILKIDSNKIFYTGYHLFKFRAKNLRILLSKIFGGLCNVFILKKND